MKISGFDAAPGKAADVQENAVMSAPTGSVNTTKVLSRDEESGKEWQVSDSFLRKAVAKANETMAFQNRFLEFHIHEKTNEVIVKVVDSKTKEVIREIPSEKMLDILASMLELAGLLVDERR
jgi:flagellar protein FlaG